MSRIIVFLKKDWEFHLGDVQNGQAMNFETDFWENVSIPHDWSIEGPFKERRDENWGMMQSLDHRIGNLPQGIGWYRTSLFIPKEYSNKIIYIQFEGVYRNSDVWINEKHLGNRPYGYSTFYYDLTPHLKFGEFNILAVRVNNVGVSSRWYAGSGIYRKVSLILMDKIHIAHWGTYWTTPEATAEKATVNLRTWIINETGNDSMIDLESQIFDHVTKTMVTSITTPVKLGKGKTEVFQQFVLNSPKLWSPETPHLYQIKSTIIVRSEVLDEYWTPLGVRSFRFDPDQGFFLNNVNMKFRGVCLHHDNGCLGAREFPRAIQRKLEILKSFGCNAIRTSHNPPSLELLEMCDEMGFMVMDEAFDEWKDAKTPFGYWHNFDEWYERDVTDFVRRDRNHPCVIMWSCGNEVHEQTHKSGVEILKKLLTVFHREDPSRPVTQGGNQMEQGNETGFAELLDIAGYNYCGDRVVKMETQSFLCGYDVDHQKYPKRIMIGSENVSALTTRGVYHFPIARDSQDKRDDFHCNSYDTKTELTLLVMKTRPYVTGCFIWEGFDYLGEPTPYNWPTRSSQYGIVDTCGFPKDLYYLYQSQWLKTPMIHIVPANWNWHPGMTIPVWVYTNCESVELFLNGKSLGEQKQTDLEFDQLYMIYDVIWEAGALVAIGKVNGQQVVKDQVITTQQPHHLKLSADRNTVHSDGDLVYITVSVHDIADRQIPDAHNLVNFHIKGPGKIVGVDNGNPLSHEPFMDRQIHVFNGLALVVIETTEGSGEIEIKVASAHLETALVIVQVQKS